jgi:hypothetical protein
LSIEVPMCLYRLNQCHNDCSADQHNGKQGRRAEKISP